MTNPESRDPVRACWKQIVIHWFIDNGHVALFIGPCLHAGPGSPLFWEYALKRCHQDFETAAISNTTNTRECKATLTDPPGHVLGNRWVRKLVRRGLLCGCLLGHSSIACLLSTGHEDSEDSCKIPWNTSGGTGSVNSIATVMDSLIIQRTQYPEPEGRVLCYGAPRDVRRSSQCTFRSQEESLWVPSSEDVLVEIQPVFLSGKDQSEDTRDGHNTFWATTDITNGTVSSSINEGNSIFIIQREQYTEPHEGSVSFGVPQDSRRAIYANSMSLWESSSDDILMGVPGFLPRPEQPISEPAPFFQNHEANSTLVGQQERLCRDLKAYKCEECPRTFKYPCNLSSHQRKHRKERSYFCTECQKGFYRGSELRVHEVVHKPEKPFTCTTCGRSFRYKTNLQAHERIHTGEKPYICSVCNHSFRQSSTYHRHLRSYHKLDWTMFLPP